MEEGKMDPSQQQQLPYPSAAGQLPGQSVSNLPYPAQPIAPPTYDASQNMQQGFVAPPHIPPGMGSSGALPPGPPMAPNVVPQPTQRTTLVYQVVNDGPGFGTEPVRTKCQNCHNEIRTQVKKESGLGAYLLGGFLCLIGCWCGCCLIPCCMDNMNVFTHSCPSCRKVLGKYKGSASLA